MASKDNSVDLAKKWLLDSGIQNVGKSHPLEGGFNSWFDMNNKNYPFIYSEITGYGISVLLYLNAASQDKIFLDRARLAAEWLMKFALHRSGGAMTRHYYEKKDEQKEYSFSDGLLFTFDSGMVMYGLMMLYKETKGERYLEAAERIAGFIIKCQRKDGLLYAAYDPNKDNFVDDPKKWSSQSGSFHAKTALGFLEIYEATQNNSYKKAAVNLCDAVLEIQENNGRFVTLKDSGGTNFHPHLYSAEGLYFTGIKLANKKYLEAASKAVVWVLENQTKTGGIPCMFAGGRFNQNERSDVVAQTLRLFALLANGSKSDWSDYTEKAKILQKRLLTFQNLDAGTEEKQVGGFFYGWDENGNKLNHLNSWCTMFAVQALSLYDSFANGKDIVAEPFV